LHRMEDMVMTGKRHAYSSDFKIGLNKELRSSHTKQHFFKTPEQQQIFHLLFWRERFFIVLTVIMFQT